MNITIIGTGYVGLVSGAAFAQLGHNVTCVDKLQDKIERLSNGQVDIYEPGLQQLVQDNMAAGRLHFGSVLADAMRGADAVFIAVGTPTDAIHGGANMTHVFAAAAEIAEHIVDDICVVVKSTVPVGTGRRVRDIIEQVRPGLHFYMVSNPEFLREGSAVADFMQPDRVVVGVEDHHGEAMIRRMYAPLIEQGVQLVVADLQTSELSKYAANAYLAARISFINEISNLCEKTGANIERLGKAIGLDSRIGEKYLTPGPGFGGSCFPKDTLALRKMALDHHVPTHILDAVINFNDLRKIEMAGKVVDALNGNVAGKHIAVLGLAFKANTDDVRESPALYIIRELVSKGAVIHAYDPEASNNAQQALHDCPVTYCDSLLQAVQDADAAVFVTEWPEFKQLDLDILKRKMHTPLVVDMRLLFTRRQMKEAGIRYISVGRSQE